MKNKKLLIIIGIVVILMAGLVGYAAYSNYKQQDEIAHAAAGVYKSHLDLYYVVEGKYPMSIPDMISTMKNNPGDFPSVDKEQIDGIKLANTRLPNFKYEVRGDEQAYRFEYTDPAGKKEVVKGEYQKDYQ